MPRRGTAGPWEDPPLTCPDAVPIPRTGAVCHPRASLSIADATHPVTARRWEDINEAARTPVIDSPSVKAADTLGKDSHGYDAGKKINGRKRHPVVDTKGLPLLVMVTRPT